MHVVKATSIGQTLALAKCTDSGGKKYRPRLSKEERKAVAETFIKKYQETNNGKFPSLRLAHKEVGGSFYTVREVVREIIQENRVLGPAKLTADELETDQFPEQYPLGSISIEPERRVPLPTNESVSACKPVICEEVVPTSNGQFGGHQQQESERALCLNGFLVDGESKEADASKSSVHANYEKLDTDVSNNRVLVQEMIEESEVLGPAQLTADEQKNDQFPEQYLLGTLSVEPQGHASFPTNESHSVSINDQIIREEASLTSNGKFTGQKQAVSDSSIWVDGILADGECKEVDASKSSVHSIDEKLDTGMQNSQEAELVQKIKSTSKVTHLATDVTVEVFPVQSFSEVIQVTDQTYIEARESDGDMVGMDSQKVDVRSQPSKTDTILNGVIMKKHSSVPADEKYEEKCVDPLSIYCSDNKSIADSSIESEGIHAGGSCTDDLTLQITIQNQVVPGMKPKLAPSKVQPKNNVYDVSSSQAESLSQEEVGTDSRADNGRSSTLNRTKLESWEGASKKSAETNPVWGVFKAFITAFVKFWTE